MAEHREGLQEVTLDDACDECSRPMELTGDSLCRTCHEADEARWTCIVCGGRTIFANERCSDACEEEYARWPEP